MKKGTIFDKIFGIALVFAVVGAMFGGLPGIANSPPAEAAGTTQPGKASTVSAAVDGALGETLSIVYGFSKPRIEKKWDSRMGKADFSVPSATIERRSLPTDGYVAVTMEALHQWSEAC